MTSPDQDIIEKIEHHIYRSNMDFDMLAMMNLLEDAANEIRQLRGHTQREKEYG